jgi:ceramide glucosyltransferase
LILAPCLAAAALLGLGQALAGQILLRRFLRDTPQHGVAPVSVLKPIGGDEPLLEAALETLFRQEHPEFQVVLGIQNPSDPALGLVQRLCARYPERDVALVVSGVSHGANGKVSNLINMLPAARHATLVIADADVHAPPHWLADVVARLEAPGIGLVTALYTGLPAARGIVGSLGAMAISHGFLPGALLARAFGRQDCFGSTMALRRTTLEAVGGLAALADHLADDNLLGVLVKREGLGIALARTLVATTVSEARLAALFRHELRWARTIRRLEPRGYAASVLQFPLFWAAAAALADWRFAGLFALAWAIRGLLSRAGAAALDAVPSPGGTWLPIWLWPLRDVLSVVVWGTSFLSDTVSWRGALLRAAPVPNEPMGHQPR